MKFFFIHQQNIFFTQSVKHAEYSFVFSTFICFSHTFHNGWFTLMANQYFRHYFRYLLIILFHSVLTLSILLQAYFSFDSLLIKQLTCALATMCYFCPLLLKMNVIFFHVQSILNTICVILSWSCLLTKISYPPLFHSYCFPLWTLSAVGLIPKIALTWPYLKTSYYHPRHCLSLSNHHVWVVL